MNFNDGKKNEEMLCLRIPRDMKKEIYNLAKKEKVSPAFIVRKALQEFLKELSNE